MFVCAKRKIVTVTTKHSECWIYLRFSETVLALL